jgi:hypothetical protein
MSQYLRNRFDAMQADGLVDVKFDIRMTPDDGGLKQPLRSFAETFSAEGLVLEKFFGEVRSEVEALYRAVDAGFEAPLDFGDSTRVQSTQGRQKDSFSQKRC